MKFLRPTHPPVRVLDPGRGRTKVCQFWAHATDDRSWKGPAPPAVAYVFAGGRGKKEILTQLTGFEGVLQVDGYAAYASLAGDKNLGENSPRVLSRSRAKKLRRRPQDDELAIRQRGHRTHRGRLRD